MKRKGQIQSGESITVVIIVIILIILGLVFGFNREQSANTDAKAQQEQLSAVRITEVATNLDELKCSRFKSTGNLCMDIYKAKALSGIIKEDKENAYKTYYEMFRNSQINISIIYPNPENIQIYDYNDSINKSSKTSFTPLVVWDPVKKVKSFAIMEVSTYN